MAIGYLLSLYGPKPLSLWSFAAIFVAYIVMALVVVWPRIVEVEPWRPFSHFFPTSVLHFYIKLILVLLPIVIIVATILGFLHRRA
jgi:hypothetical protein